MHFNVTCNACLGMVSKATPLGATEPEEATQATEETARKEQPKEKNKETTVQRKAAPKKKAPPKKKRASTSKKKSQQSLDLVPPKLLKSAAAQSYRLQAATGKQDPLIMKSVCFCLSDDAGYGKELADHFQGVKKIESSLVSVEDKVYLFGNVVRAAKLPKKGNSNVLAYDVEWEDQVLGETKVDLQVIVPAIDLSIEVRRRQKAIDRKGGRPRKYRPDKLYDNDTVKSLFVVQEGEDGDPMDSGSDEEYNDDLENDNSCEDNSNEDDLFIAQDGDTSGRD